MNKHRVTSARSLLLAASASCVLATCSPYVIETREGAGAVAPYFFGLQYVTLYAGSARTDLWAFGSEEVSRCQLSQSAAAARWDGSRWTLTPLPADLGPAIAAVAIAPNEAWMVAPACSTVEGYALVRWNGVEWAVVGRNRDWQNAEGLVSIRRASATDVWVHLATTNIAGPPRVAISRWNGAALSQIPAPPDTSSLVVGIAVDAEGSAYVGAGSSVYRFRDGAWTTATTLDSAVRITALAQTRPGEFVLGATDGLRRFRAGALSPRLEAINDTVVRLHGFETGQFFALAQRCTAGSFCAPPVFRSCGSCSSFAFRGDDQGTRGCDDGMVFDPFRTSDGRFWVGTSGASPALSSFE
jgi:hypothetical protein